MSAHNIDHIVALIGVVSDGAPLNWDDAEAQASDDTERVYLRRLKLVSEIAHFHSLGSSAGAASWSGRPPMLDTSSAAWATRLDDEFAASLPSEWGPLKILEPVARGTFGDVYRAWDTRLDREVALKLLRRRESPTAVESSVIDEGRLMARVRHPNVITVYGAERLDARVGLWMEFIHGRTLEQELREDGPFNIEQAARLGIELCGALSAVHEAGLLHRDVKAHNVMRDRDGRVMLGDFGTGRALEETAALDGHLAGTPLYLAPEVLEGRPATPHSDQYSLGVLLYHLVTGSYPVRGRTVAEIRLAHAHGDRTAIAERLPDAPRRFTDIVDRVIDPDPTRRYEGIEELGGALTAFVGVESTSLLAPDVDTPMRKTSRRWWLAGSLAAGLIVTAGVLLQLRTNATGDPPGSVPAPTSLTVRRITAGAVPMRPTHDFRHFGCTDRETQDLALCELFDDDFRQIRRITNRGASGDDARYFWGAFSPNGLEVAYTAEGPDGVQEARIIGIDGAGHRLLRRGFEGVAFVSLLSWTDPDEILAFLDLPDKSAELVFLSVTDGSIQSILQLATNSSAISCGHRNI